MWNKFIFKPRRLNVRLKKQFNKEKIISCKEGFICVRYVGINDCKILEKYYKGYQVNVWGDVNLYNCALQKLPNILFNEVKGSFHCNSNILNSLEGCPKKVRRHFYCKNNAAKFTCKDVKKLCKVKINICC